MGKTDAIVRDLGASLGEEIGVRDTHVPAPDAPDQPPSPANPLDDLTRLKGAGMLPIERVVPDPEQPRQKHDPEADAQLVESVRSKGLLQPIRVRLSINAVAGSQATSNTDRQGTWYVVVGERRYRAAVAAGLEHIPVIRVEGDPTPAEILEEQLVENLQRVAMDALDQARAYRRYLDMTGGTAKSLAETLHVHPGTISRSLALLDLDPVVQAAVDEGKLSPKAALPIGRIKNPKVQQRVAAEAVATQAPAAEVARTVRSRRGTPAKAKSGPLVFKVARGVRVTVHATAQLSGAAIIAALRTATDMAVAEYEQEQAADEN